MSKKQPNKIGDLIPDDRNANKHTEYGTSLMDKGLRQNGFGRSILISNDNKIIAGNGITEAAGAIGLDDVLVVNSDGKKIIAIKRTDIESGTKEFYSMALSDNIISEKNICIDAQVQDAICDDYEIEDWKNAAETEIDGADEKLPIPSATANLKLSERFIIPPFSVFDTKQGYWQERKRYWLSIGIKSELGRGDNILGISQSQVDYMYNKKEYTGKRKAECLPVSIGEDYGRKIEGTSIFDPVLCEILNQWFNIPCGTVLDPFAGGSVRGIVAAKLGFNYIGIDLRQEQIEANIKNAYEVLAENSNYPVWHCGNSLNIDKIANGVEADFVFSCPPYHDLEVYSDDKEDLSNLSYEEFIKQYKEIIKKSIALLKNDRFACFVVGDIRDKKGFYKNFVSDTIRSFEEAGAMLYNEIILVNVAGSLPIRAGRQFNSGRKVGKMHQNVLVFYKGDPKNIKENFPELDLSQFEETAEQVSET